MRPFAAYDRRALHPGIVHVGPGVFHRAHQAVYHDQLLARGATDAATWGISLRSSAVRDALAPTDFVYHVVEVAGSPVEPTPSGERVLTIGSLLGITVATEDIEASLRRLADPRIRVVTMTVTEHGYCAVNPGGPLDIGREEIVHDLANPADPRSLPGLLLAALMRRRAAGVAPFTVASCDNLPANGAAIARVLTDLAECHDPALATWIAANVAFPSSMVDRMVPTTTATELQRCRELGVGDEWPIITEPFSQWVVEDTFPSGRPDWGDVGVELVRDVSTHEQAKLRILNAAHSALAYWGLLAGHRYIWQAVADSAVHAAARELLVTEAIPTLATPPGWDLPRYAESVLERFANRSLPYTTSKVAGDGSQKLPVRLMPTLQALFDAGRPAPRCAQVLAAWIATTAGPRAGQFELGDAALRQGPAGDVLARAGSVTPRAATAVLLSLPGFLPPGTRSAHPIADAVAHHAAAMWSGDVRAVLTAPPTSPVPGSPSAAPLSEGTS